MSTTTQVPTRLTPNAPTPAAQRQSVWKHGTVPLPFRQIDVISPTPLRGNPGCVVKDVDDLTEGR